MNSLAYGRKPGGPTDKLCPSEEPNEAMAARGPDGRMVPTFLWRAHTPANRDAMRLHSNRIARPSHSYPLCGCSSGATRNTSPLETV